MKYICFETDDGDEEIIVFPRTIDHDCMAESVRGIKNQSFGNWKRVRRQPISAGFVDDMHNCHGESLTLNLKSRGEVDSNILIIQLNKKF